MKSLNVTIQMKAAEQYFPVELFILQYKMVLTFESVDEIVSVTIKKKATEQYVSVVLFILQFRVLVL